MGGWGEIVPSWRVIANPARSPAITVRTYIYYVSVVSLTYYLFMYYYLYII